MSGVTTANSPPGVIFSSVAAAHALAKTNEPRMNRTVESCILLVEYTGIGRVSAGFYKVKLERKVQEREVISGGET